MELNLDALENSKIHTVSSEDLINLSDILKLKLEKFVVNEPSWDIEKRNKPRFAQKNDAISSAADDDENIEVRNINKDCL